RRPRRRSRRGSRRARGADGERWALRRAVRNPSGCVPMIYYLGIAELGKRIRNREISPVEIVDRCLARIDAIQSRLNAFIRVLPERARERAREAAAQIAGGEWRGPLHGVPIGIKDFYDTAGVGTTAAFEHFRNRVPAKDAVVVGKLERAGAIVI